MNPRVVFYATFITMMIFVTGVTVAWKNKVRECEAKNAALLQQLREEEAHSADLQKQLDEARASKAPASSKLPVPVEKKDSAPPSATEPQTLVGKPKVLGDIPGMKSPCNWPVELWPLLPEILQTQVCQIEK